MLLVALLVFAMPVRAVAEEPQNGIPLLIVYVDESDTGIAAANADDAKHTYGTIEQMLDSDDHSVRCVGDVQIVVPNGYVGDYGSSMVPEGRIALKYLRGRGNSTWAGASKKPFKMEFQKKQDLFGMGASKDWALMANSFDNSVMRNRITSWLGTRLGLPYTPQMIPVDVIMVGVDGDTETSRDYLGSYYLSETVKVEGVRVGIDKLDEDVVEDDPNADPNITGGYLLAMYSPVQDADEPASNVFSTGSGMTFINDTPKFVSEDLTEGQSAQRSYIRDYVDAIDSLITGPDEIDDATHDAIAKLLDLRSAADYWWMQEFAFNTDAFITGSTYLYKPRGGKLSWGPLWDFDLAYSMGMGSELGSVTGFNNTAMAWSDNLREKDPQYVDLLKERWRDPDTGLDAQLEELTRTDGTLDQYKEELAQSWEANFARWGDNAADMAEVSKGFEEEIEDLRHWIDVRRAWINEHLDEIGQVRYTLTYLVGDDVFDSILVRGCTLLEDGPIAPRKEGQVFLRWKEQQTGTDHNGMSVNEDLVFVADYVSESEVETPKALYFQNYEEWASLALDYYVMQSMVVIPEDAPTGGVTWTSSDESVAVFDKGYLKLVGLGDVTITATLGNGVSNSFLLHVYNPATLLEVDPTGIEAARDLTLHVGEFDQVRYTLQPEGQPLKYRVISFEADDPTVVQFDENGMGVATGLKPGTTTVTIRAESFEDDDPLLEATCTITVLGEDRPEPDVPDEPVEPDVPDEPVECVISYDLNGGTYDGRSGTITETYEQGTRIRVHKAPVRAGYEFSYWKGSRYQPGDSYVVEHDHTFVAQWKRKGSGGDNGPSSTKPGGKTLPKTGDTGDPIVWQVLTAVGALMLACGVLARAKASQG